MNALTSPPSSNVTSREISREGLAKAVRILADDKPVEIMPLLPEWVCDVVIARYSGPFPAMSAALAPEAVLTLLSGHPYAFKGDETEKVAYMRRIEAVFAKYPEWAASAVLAVGTGLAAKSRFLPTEAELTAALETEVAKARTYAVKAAMHKAESARRAKERELDAACAQTTPEQRAAQVAKALGSLKRMSDASEAA